MDALYQGDLKQAGEIRQRTAKWGGTVEDRARLRMRFKEDGKDEPADAGQVPDEAEMDHELYKLLGGE
ncbi:hypothetical protein [Streptomyces sp. CFMR 7]|uniref:phage terminase small subunit n=1 Tax=Streptomyces sp. CFMR 7 TaxID=1649184 RepID=UPI0021B5294C|nr:hypothetical protein [Streptomyces sp. CFMR 7]